MISIISGILFRLGGCGQNDRLFPFLQPPTPFANKWWRWGMGLLIALYTGNPIYILTYFVAVNVFGYGESHPLTKLFGRFNWFISGFMFGLASLSLLNGAVMGCVFYLLMVLSNEGIPSRYYWGVSYWKLDHAYLEFLTGFSGTLIFLIRRFS